MALKIGMGRSDMEVALARLVGAGLTLVFEGFEEAAPSGAVENGFKLIEHIARERPDVVGTLVQGVVRDIWREWKLAKLPREVAVSHIEALPGLMERCRSSDGMMLGAVAAIQVARRMGATGRQANHSARVATAIIGRAIETGLLMEQGLTESLAFFFLDRLLARLMPDQALFLDLRPLFRTYLERGLWNPDASAHAPAAPVASPFEPKRASAATAPSASPRHLPGAEPPPYAEEAARLAAGIGLPVAALFHIIDLPGSRAAKRGGAQLEELVRGLGSLLAALRDPDDLDPEAAALRQQAAERIADCDLTAADELLGQAEDLHLHAAPLDPATAHQRLQAAAAARVLRAELEELCGDFRRAARQYAAAARCLPEGDRKGRRSYLLRQARALAGRDFSKRETAALAEAAQTYTEAGRLLSEQDDPVEWASANLEIGHILMALGEREKRPERFLAAAVHFKPASDVFSRMKLADEWARAQLGIADALRSQGAVQGDVVTLSEAAFAYRAALGIATRERMPTEWGGASYRLALTLLRLDRETGEVTNHEEAVMALRAVLAAASADGDERLQFGASVCLAEALITLGTTRGETWLADEALGIIRKRQTAIAHIEPSDRAEMDDGLGSVLRMLGEARGDPELIAEAAEMKLAALDHFEANAMDDEAERVRAELHELERAIEAHADSPSEGAAA